MCRKTLFKLHVKCPEVFSVNFLNRASVIFQWYFLVCIRVLLAGLLSSV